MSTASSVEGARNVLFLCTGNSARSILAESLLNASAGGRFRAFSAGSQPKGEPHPEALRLLARRGLPIAGLRSKSWDEFAVPGAPMGTPAMDIVITVCDAAAGESCPIWPGRPVRGHWGIPDPAAVTAPAEAVTAAFEEAEARLARMIGALLALPEQALRAEAIGSHLARIGHGEQETA